jgi:flagellar assembly protein FliH
MSSSETRARARTPGALSDGTTAASTYSRFIPREELGHFASWQPQPLTGATASAPARDGTPAAPAAPDAAARIDAARQTGYQDGYRDGLAALDAFKRSFAQQASERIGQWLRAFDEQLLALEQDMARAVADTATLLARQVVREELVQDPERIARVAQEALAALLLSAKHITLRVHPDDEALVRGGAGDALASRGARLVVDEGVQRGGCRIDSDIGVIDATIETRWKRALDALGADLPLQREGEDD